MFARLGTLANLLQNTAIAPHFPSSVTDDLLSECTRRARCCVKSEVSIFHIPSVSAVINLPNKYLKNEKSERSSLEFQTGRIPLGVPFTQPQGNKRYQTRARSEWKNDKIRQGDRGPSCTRKLHHYGMLLCGTIGQVGPWPPRCEVSRSQAIINTSAQTQKHARTHGRTPPNDCTSRRRRS